MKPTPLPTKTINIPAELHRQLKVQAALEGKTLQELIVETLAAALGIEVPQE
jgi:predicted HicB family RNase H-like nuclease